MLDRSIAPPFGEINYQSFPQVSRHVLSSGIPVFLLNTSEQSVLKFELKLKCGSWYESQKAVAWFTAKMLVEGTTKKSANDISQAFESLGAFIEIEPGFDNVSISIYGMHRNFTEVLSLLAEVLNTPSFPVQELDILKELRADEIKTNDSKSNMLASKKMREALFGLNHPYGKALLTEDIQQLDVENVKNYFKSTLFNLPEIFISGKADDSLIHWLDDHFTLPYVHKIEKNIVEPIAPTINIFVEKKDSLQSSIRLAWNCPKLQSADYFDFLISTSLLGGYFGSRLMKNIREDKGYTYGINAYSVDLKRHSFSIIGTDVKSEFTQDTIDEIWKEIDRLINEPTSPKEIEMVVNYLAGKFQSSLSTPFKIMSKFTKIHAAGLGYEHYEHYYESLMGFSEEKLRRSISKHFNKSNVHQVVVGQLRS